jgi:hypothetical protein
MGHWPGVANRGLERRELQRLCGPATIRDRQRAAGFFPPTPPRIPRRAGSRESAEQWSGPLPALWRPCPPVTCPGGGHHRRANPPPCPAPKRGGNARAAPCHLVCPTTAPSERRTPPQLQLGLRRITPWVSSALRRETKCVSSADRVRATRRPTARFGRRDSTSSHDARTATLPSASALARSCLTSAVVSRSILSLVQSIVLAPG